MSSSHSSPRLAFPPSPFARLSAVSDYETSRTRLAVHVPRRDVFLTRVVGHVDRDAAERIVAALARPIELGVSPRVWHDWDRVTRCDADACQLFLRFIRDARASVRHIAILACSEPVSGEIALVERGAALGGVPIVRHPDRGAFEGELMHALETP